VIRIMFVCHGNICRSPMAEFIMKRLAALAGVSDKIEIFSSATSDEEIYHGVGNPIYPPAARELSRRQIPYTPRRAVKLVPSMLDGFDMFVGMDSANIRNMHRILGSAAEGKISRLMDYTDRRGADVADPWYSGRFDVAFDDIFDGCQGLLKYLKGENLI